MNSAQIDKPLSKIYSQIILERGDQSPAELCRKYYDILKSATDVNLQNESRIWLLLSYIYDDSFEFPPFYRKLLKKHRNLRFHVRYFLWLCHIYDYTRQNKGEYSAFEYFRSGQIEEFKEKVQSSNENDDDWAEETFLGAFSFSHFKKWSETVLSLASDKNLTVKNFDLYLSIAGDLETNNSLAKNEFDRMWSILYQIISNAASKKSYKLSLPPIQLDDPSNIFASMAITIFENHGKEIKALSSNSSYPILFRIHVGAVFNQFDIDLLESYIESLTHNGEFGLIAFYASLIGLESSIAILTNVFALFEPSEQIIKVFDTFGIDKVSVICSIVDRLAHCTIDDFDAVIDKEDLNDAKIRILKWFSLVDELKDRSLVNIRKIFVNLLLSREYKSAKRVYDQFKNLFSENNQKESGCWFVLLHGELVYNDWIKSGIPLTPIKFKELKDLLLNILCFPNGWMIDCPGVNKDVGSHFVPLVADQLLDLYMNNNEPQNVLGLGPIIMDTTNRIDQYFTKKQIVGFLLKCKTAYPIAFPVQ